MSKQHGKQNSAGEASSQIVIAAVGYFLTHPGLDVREKALLFEGQREPSASGAARKIQITAPAALHVTASLKTCENTYSGIHFSIAAIYFCKHRLAHIVPTDYCYQYQSAWHLCIIEKRQSFQLDDYNASQAQLYLILAAWDALRFFEAISGRGSQAMSEIQSYIKGKNRRTFLASAAAAAAAAAVFGVDVRGLKLSSAFAQAAAVDVGSGDFGILNYAYALEQLEAAFYTQVLATPYRGMSAYEAQVLTGIRDHEISHRQTFALALTIFAIPDLTPNFSKVNFDSRASVLGTARAFEDLGVSAYNGGGQYLTNPLFLALAGSIVSVEARHAALIRDMLHPHSAYFAGDDIVDRAGLDAARLPSQVLPIAAPYVATPLSASQLP